MICRPIPVIALVAITAFWFATALLDKNPPPNDYRPPAIVISEPLQVLLAAGDRYLAANIDSIRAAASATTTNAESFRLRSHIAASRLNPCHEDNYWIGNASLSWGGAESKGMDLLKNAIRCRYWDEWPPFLYGFNQYFFQHNPETAYQTIELAAERSSGNAAAFKTFAIMLKVGEIDDTKIALDMLKNERDKAKTPALRKMLDKRVSRLNGLLILRNAQEEYETRSGRSLKEPEELIKHGILKSFPNDPMNIGYEFRDNTFHLLERKIK